MVELSCFKYSHLKFKINRKVLKNPESKQSWLVEHLITLWGRFYAESCYIDALDQKLPWKIGSSRWFASDFDRRQGNSCYLDGAPIFKL